MEKKEEIKTKQVSVLNGRKQPLVLILISDRLWINRRKCQQFETRYENALKKIVSDEVDCEESEN